MDKADVTLKNACVALENLIDSYKNRLAALDEEIQAKSGSSVSIPRSDVERASINAAIENLKHCLATFQSEIKTLDKSSAYHLYPDEILSNVSKLCQAESSKELQEILVQEKLRQTALKEEIKKKTLCIKENTKLLEVLNNEKKTLGSKQEELENERAKELEEKLANVRRLYGEMKLHLKDTVETYFPAPQIPGFVGMYSLLNELTQRLQNRERDTYVTLTTSIWSYYVDTLERHGIIERHPTDKTKIRIIDFSDGRLGS